MALLTNMAVEEKVRLRGSPHLARAQFPDLHLAVSQFSPYTLPISPTFSP